MQGCIPKHVAVIMDGNGRWGKKNFLTRSQGHYAGAQAMEKVIDASIACQVEVLTLYAFSSENWSRSIDEVNYLMQLPVRFFNQKLPGFMRRNIKIMISGDLEQLPAQTRKALIKAIEATSQNEGLIVNFAFNYGGRGEIIRAVKNMIKTAKSENLEMNEALVERFLYTSGLPELELIIRTGGEERISNFLLWQSAHAELYFSDIYFPDFTGADFDKAILEYQRRKSIQVEPNAFPSAR